jgi:hypothetical protein
MTAEFVVFVLIRPLADGQVIIARRRFLLTFFGFGVPYCAIELQPVHEAAMQNLMSIWKMDQAR